MNKLIASKTETKKISSGVLAATSLKVTSELIAHAYELTHMGQLASLFGATLLLFGLYNPHSSNYILISWYTFYLTIFLSRVILVHVYLKQKTPEKHLMLWKRLFIIGALLGGLSWGLVGILLFADASSTQQMLILFLLAGITAGSTPLLSAELSALLVFNSAALLPFIFQLFFLESIYPYTFYGMMTTAYYLYLVMLSIKLHNMIANALELKFENDALLENLSFTKTQLEVINKKLAHAATHDPLTNLANRSLFEMNLINALKRAQVKNEIFALLYIDLDNFKEINDAYGHHIGDQLLLVLVSRLRNNIENPETIARLGGDELTIILENILDPDAIYAATNKVCNILANPVIIQNHTIVVTASIGIGIYPLDGEDADTLLRNADKAMYYVKQHGGNNIRFSTESSKIRALLKKIKNQSTTY